MGAFRTRMESVDKWMGKRGLSKKLRHLIAQHYQEVRHSSSKTLLPLHLISGLRRSRPFSDLSRRCKHACMKSCLWLFAIEAGPTGVALCCTSKHVM